METNSHGFTIIEVMLFLAISSLLLIGVFTLSGNLIAGTRFTDSIRGLESFLQRQYEEVSSGVNPRGQVACSASTVTAGTAAPGTSNCLLLGKVIVFRAGTETVDTYNVVGSEPSIPPTNVTLEVLLASYNPKTVPESRSSYFIPWGASFSAGKRADAQPVNAVALLRSPTSSQIGVYHFPTSVAATASIDLSAVAISAAASDTTGSYCVDSKDGIAATRRAAITFGRAQGSTAIDAIFDFSAGVPC